MEWRYPWVTHGDQGMSAWYPVLSGKGKVGSLEEPIILSAIASD